MKRENRAGPSAGAGLRRCALRAAVAAALLAPAGAAAQEDGDPRRGLAFALETCGGCHGVRKGERVALSPAPPFETIAATPGMTATALQAALQTSHRTMPNLVLSADERADVIAYILTLK